MAYTTQRLEERGTNTKDGLNVIHSVNSEIIAVASLSLLWRISTSVSRAVFTLWPCWHVSRRFPPCASQRSSSQTLVPGERIRGDSVVLGSVFARCERLSCCGVRFLCRWIHPRSVRFRQFNDTLQLGLDWRNFRFQFFLAELVHLGTVSTYAVRGTCYPCSCPHSGPSLSFGLGHVWC